MSGKTPEKLTTAGPAARKVKSSGRRKWFTWLIVFGMLLVACCAVLSQAGLWQSRLALDARQNSRAASWLRVAGMCWPRNAEWHFLSAVVSRRAERFPEVESHLRMAHKLGWSVSDLEREQTLAMAQTGQFRIVGNKWSNLFKTAGSDGPEICEAYVNFALSRFRLDEAASVLEGWKADFPEDPAPYMMEGKINVVQMQWDRAEASFRRALKIDSALDEARLELAKCLIEKLDFLHAEEQLEAVSENFQSKPEVIAALANCVAQRGELQEALQLLESGVSSHPDDEILLGALGRLQLMRGQNEAAIAALKPVLAIAPANTEIRYALAQALRNSGDEKSAQEHFRLVDEGTRALRSLPQLQSKIAADPSDLDTRFTIASVTWKWKSRKDGAAWLQSILDFDPQHRGANQLLAEHCENEGNLERAAYHREMGGLSE